MELVFFFYIKLNWVHFSSVEFHSLQLWQVYTSKLFCSHQCPNNFLINSLMDYLFSLQQKLDVVNVTFTAGYSLLIFPILPEWLTKPFRCILLVYQVVLFTFKARFQIIGHYAPLCVCASFIPLNPLFFPVSANSYVMLASLLFRI